MRGRFRETGLFNLPIGNWDTSAETNMSVMVVDAQVLSQPIGNWDSPRAEILNLLLLTPWAWNAAQCPHHSHQSECHMLMSCWGQV